MLQSIIFNRKLWNIEKANLWLKINNLYPMKKGHITKNYIRYRMAPPKPNRRYITKSQNFGIKFVNMV